MRITKSLTIPDRDLTEKFIHASGPGGQNVNKVATAVQLRFDLQGSESLTEDVKNRLEQLATKQITENGELVIESSQYRSQVKNRQVARKKLAGLIRQALLPPKKRKRTRPSRASRERRLKNKRRHSQKKTRRQETFPRE
ncbi:MAG: alternative ribosome rescue aminoacyl-tRNA hydrolase ArfB [Chloroflexota bacterium]|nr:alternative ribosome rescue aminoacyl-tRNA hydrolase ArfB [Chloroflexota bacterium]